MTERIDTEKRWLIIDNGKLVPVTYSEYETFMEEMRQALTGQATCEDCRRKVKQEE